jgi:preprotein translocase subunit Sec63
VFFVVISGLHWAYLGSHFSWISKDYVPVFTRYQMRDPYKLLGVDRDASEEEIRSARNFLIQQYAGHEPSEESIEGTYEKIIMKSYQQR